MNALLDHELKVLNVCRQNGEDYNPWTAYGQSKTANILFTKGLAKKLSGKDPKTLVLNPGRTYSLFVPSTESC